MASDNRDFLADILRAAFDPMNPESVPNRLNRIELQIELNMEQAAAAQSREQFRQTTRVAIIGMVSALVGTLFSPLITQLIVPPKVSNNAADIRFTLEHPANKNNPKTRGVNQS